MNSYFDQAHLRTLGFAGFVPLRTADLSHVPRAPGLYAVLLDPPIPAFLDESVGGHFKGKNPTVGREVLWGKWVSRTPTVYIGRANNTHGRINLLHRYGQGEPVAHHGGRYLWQLAEHRRLLVAWRLEQDPVTAETALLTDFERTFGRLPFANLVRGARPVALV